MMYSDKTWYYEADTIWADRAWVHKHYLDDVVKNGVTLVIRHKDKILEVKPEEIPTRFDWCKPTKDVKTGEPVGHCGILWQS